MKKTMSFKIEGYDEPFEVRELTIRQIIDLMQDEGITGGNIGDLQSILKDKFLPLATNISLEEMMGMAPSELKEIWEHFREINKVFFEMAQRLGIQDMVEEIKKAAIADYSKLLVSLSSQDTETP